MNVTLFLVIRALRNCGEYSVGREDHRDKVIALDLRKNYAISTSVT